MFPVFSLLLFIGIHLDFSPPAGKMSFEVKEGAGNLEVCLVLANTGSYDTSATLTTPVTVSLSTYVLEANSTSYAPGQFVWTVYFLHLENLEECLSCLCDKSI